MSGHFGLRSGLTRVLGGVLVVGGLCGSGAMARAAAPITPASLQGADPRTLDEMIRDLQRFSEAVQEYRGTARHIIKRTYAQRVKGLNEKYEPQIQANEHEAKERRRDAIAMFEAFLQKYPNDKRWTPDAMFRLAELYYEKSAEEFLEADEAYKKAADSATPPTTPSPKVDYSPTITLYKRLLTEFPSYRFLDATYYLLGFCLGEMGQEPQARQALLALVCANQYKPLDPPAGLPQGDDPYKECTPVRKDSKFLPEAWTRIGEISLRPPNELRLAIAAFKKVLDFKDSPYYDRGLYKLAWSYYRDNNFPEAVRQFDNLVKWADDKKASGQKIGSDLRPEAVQYLGVSFSEPDWNGDTLPDPETNLERINAFYKGRESEPHVKRDLTSDWATSLRLHQVPRSDRRLQDAAGQVAGLFADAPRVQDKIVRSLRARPQPGRRRQGA